MFLPAVMRPLIGDHSAVPAWAATMADAPVCVVAGPPGSYVAESLAVIIRSWRRWEECVWLRTPRPASGPRLRSLRQSLDAACLSRWEVAPDASEGADPAPETPKAPEDRPETAPALRSAPAGSVIVLEFSGAVRELRRLVRAVRPVLLERQTVLIIALDGRRWWGPRGMVDRWVAADGLAKDMCLDAAGDLAGVDLDRLLLLAGRRMAVVHDVLTIAGTGAVSLVEHALGRTRTWRQLLDLLTAGLLEERTAQEREALEACLFLGYWHPQLGARLVTAHDLRPWMIPLEGGWGTLRQIWVKPLTRHLARIQPIPPHVESRPVKIVVRSRTVQPVNRQPVNRQTVNRQTVRIDTHDLDARLFGALDVRVDGIAVPRWSGQRGSSILRQLLFRRGHSCPRDELLAEFWPDVAPTAARNRLQVAISGLRRDLAEVTSANLVQYTDLSYAIAPNVQVKTDVQRFEELLTLAEAATRRADRDRAQAAYLDCLALYRGDFASDAPYEQWTLLPRESLRLRYIDALDRLSRLQLSAGRVSDCIATAQRMLESDPCREDAHRLIMSCHAGLGHTYQAFQQYESCRRVLRAALDTEPSPETVALHERIRDGSPPDLPTSG